MNSKLLVRALALVACLLCSMSGQARDLAYAVYTSEDSTLTFYYDGNDASWYSVSMPLYPNDNWDD
ncbi:MAG: hypothetical protein IJK41_09690, partial [Muribaculaceae bacterium]|nr:hypothetical protein [Muribaculaceae bacterium]